MAQFPSRMRRVDDPPTVDEVLERQRREHPEQAAVDAGGHVVGTSDGEPEIEGPNSA